MAKVLQIIIAGICGVIFIGCKDSQNTESNVQSMELIEAVIDSNLKTTPYKIMYDDNRVKVEGQKLVNNAESISVGIWKTYYPNGTIQTQKSYNVKGQKHGSWVWYSDDGKVRAQKHYKDNEIQYYKVFYPSGALQDEGFIGEDGRGYGKIYYENGAVFYDKVGIGLVDNKEEGLGIIHDPQQFYTDIIYDEAGNILIRVEYKNNTLNGYYRYYAEPIRVEGYYELGKKVGQWHTYQCLGNGAWDKHRLYDYNSCEKINSEVLNIK